MNHYYVKTTYLAVKQFLKRILKLIKYSRNISRTYMKWKV